MERKKILFEVEFEPAKIRHAYVTCPECGKKFNANDIKDDNAWIDDEFDLTRASYSCPCCSNTFGVSRGAFYDYDVDYKVYNHEVKEVGYPECAKGALQRKEVWE